MGLGIARMKEHSFCVPEVSTNASKIVLAPYSVA